MRTIAHISDLHFGREDPELAEALAADLTGRPPSLLVVSGDLTQRATEREFLAARDYLARLPRPQLVVPGNHDIPLFDVALRFTGPLHRYRRFISDDVNPFHRDQELAVLGINTARSLTVKDGRVSAAQLRTLESRLCALPAEVFKVVVTHHHFASPPGQDRHRPLGRAELALRVIEDCGVDLLLAGHVHAGHAADLRLHFAQLGRSIIAAQAGTTISRRGRGEPNGYNWVELERDRLQIEFRVWSRGRFRPKECVRFERAGHEWRRTAGEVEVVEQNA